MPRVAPAQTLLSTPNGAPLHPPPPPLPQRRLRAPRGHGRLRPGPPPPPALPPRARPGAAGPRPRARARPHRPRRLQRRPARLHRLHPRLPAPRPRLPPRRLQAEGPAHLSSIRIRRATATFCANTGCVPRVRRTGSAMTGGTRSGAGGGGGLSTMQRYTAMAQANTINSSPSVRASMRAEMGHPLRSAIYSPPSPIARYATRIPNRHGLSDRGGHKGVGFIPIGPQGAQPGGAGRAPKEPARAPPDHPQDHPQQRRDGRGVPPGPGVG